MLFFKKRDLPSRISELRIKIKVYGNMGSLSDGALSKLANMSVELDKLEAANKTRFVSHINDKKYSRKERK